MKDVNSLKEGPGVKKKKPRKKKAVVPSTDVIKANKISHVYYGDISREYEEGGRYQVTLDGKTAIIFTKKSEKELREKYSFVLKLPKDAVGL